MYNNVQMVCVEELDFYKFLVQLDLVNDIGIANTRTRKEAGVSVMYKYICLYFCMHGSSCQYTMVDIERCKNEFV